MSDEVLVGKQVRVAMWHETAAGWASETPTTPVIELPVDPRFNIGETQELIDSAIARGTRGQQVPYDGLIRADGLRLVVVAHYKSIGHIIKQLTKKTITTSGVGPYTHTTASLGALLPGFGLEIAIVDPDVAANSRLYRAYGCKLTRVSFPFAKPAGEMPWELTFSASKVAKLANGAPITATEYDESPIIFNNQTVLSINDGGGADSMGDLLEASVVIDVGSELHHTSHNAGRAGMYSVGETKITGQLRALLHKDSPYEALAEAGTHCVLISTIAPDANNSFSVELPIVRIAKGPLAPSGPGGIPLDRSFGAYEDVDEDADSPVVFTWINADVTTYPDPV